MWIFTAEAQRKRRGRAEVNPLCHLRALCASVVKCLLPDPQPSSLLAAWQNVFFLLKALSVAAFPVIIFSSDAVARVGGGHSYSGGSHGGGGGDGGGGLIILLFRLLWLLLQLTINYPLIGIPLDLLIGVAIVYYFLRPRSSSPPAYFSSRRTTGWDNYVRLSTAGAPSPAQPATVAARFDQLRRYDPNFSETLFTDFIYTLYARAQEARGRQSLNDFSPYLDARVIQKLQAQDQPQMVAVTGIIIAASRIVEVSDPARPQMTISVIFETNYTENYGTDGTVRTAETYYAKERWEFTRKRDLLSRTPEKATALHCPKCGGPLERRPDGSCIYCGVKIVGGDFDWFVTEVRLLERESKGPLLTADVPEEGTDLPTVFQPGFEAARQAFMALNQDFSWPQMEARIRHIFIQLQEAWSNLEWERARPYETDNVFQTHLFWITEYERQHLRNVLRDIQISQVIPVKISSDRFYDAITVRIYAAMIDYTADTAGRVVSGDARHPRRFTEYWTFIRRRGARDAKTQNTACPNCGAPLKINMAGICEYCGGKITSGEFDWVLSRIEQDEAYQG